MKKNTIIFLSLCLLFFSILPGQQETSAEKSDPLKDFSLVKETQPAPEKVKTGLESITAEDAVAYLKFLTSDLLEGRDTASPGFYIAAHYTASMFELWGIKPAGDIERPQMSRYFMRRDSSPRPTGKRTYFQNIPMIEILGNEGSAYAEYQKGRMKQTKSFNQDTDYTYYASESRSLSAPVVFVGYGIQEPSLKLDEYKGLDVKDKFIMMLSETPGKDDPESPFNKGELKEKYYPQRRRMRRSSSPKTELAMEQGALAILLVENSPENNGDVPQRTINRSAINDERPIIPGHFRRISLYERGNISRSWERIPTITISRAMADDLLGFNGLDITSLKNNIEKDLKSQSRVLEGVTLNIKNKAETKLVNSMNVLGIIEGSDPELKKEAIVIGGHLDHLGRRGDYIYNGADDNGSGSVGVMEIAEAFAKNPIKPKRSIIFALWTGEEKGLLGSRYYVTHPFIEKTAVNLNLDMISRTYEKERMAMMARRWGIQMSKEVLDKIDADRYVSLSYDAHTPQIEQIIRKNNDYVGLHIHISASKEASGGSDHAPFATQNIPWAFFIAAMTEDYHQPSDTVEKINAKLMERIIRMTYLTAFELADR
ncbi:MAG: M20/M25/M40 family metallo-hydrolase [Candidatus Aminicenantes bacterium]|nr:M20/M25/M40 family metallo-hydrolase [Candidatus Aminicenantes bacterium]